MWSKCGVSSRDWTYVSNGLLDLIGLTGARQGDILMID